ncbi:MAG: peroxiredoxin [Cyanobacteria bacterium J06641_5]
MFSRNWLRSLSIFIALLASLWLGNPSEAAWALGGKQPDLGDPAPTFTLPSTTGEGEVSLGDYRGQWVVLYFYPKDFTPGCTVEARRFQQDLPKYEARNAQIVGVSADDVESHVEFCDSEGLRFPLLADLDGDVSKAYGSWMGFVSLRHTYLIDPAGRLQEIFTAVRPIVHSQEVLARLDELQAG